MRSGSELAREEAIKAAANLAFQLSTVVPMLRVGMPSWTLRLLLTSSHCDAERHTVHSHAAVRNNR
ncbi:hypothetical protein F4W67_08950 [Pseudomonas caricapapayae]|nr:hypothetical protein F4W67_08950 [Pseudomonas caricapapayae]